MPTIRFTAGNQAMETAIDQQLGLDFMDTVLILYTLSWPSMLIRSAASGKRATTRSEVQAHSVHFSVAPNPSEYRFDIGHGMCHTMI